MKHMRAFLFALICAVSLVGCSFNSNYILQYDRMGIDASAGLMGGILTYSNILSDDLMIYLILLLILMFLVLAVTVFLLIRNIKLSKKLKEAAHYDMLTGIFNRRFFMEIASLQVARSSRTNAYCYLAIFDLDRFKTVNDTYGHLAGDKVLVDIAQRVKKTIRPYDIFGRFGGEEFIILMSDTKDIDKDDVIKIIERIRLELCSTPVEYEGKAIRISASFGVAYAAPINDMETATKYADLALYRAKEGGRNRVEFYNQELELLAGGENEEYIRK